jgi:hypothetical protein
MVRMDDNSFRTFAYQSSSRDPEKTRRSTPHHTGAAACLGAANTIGGFITKTGVGSCGWVFHTYQASFRDDLAPIHSHCGDGADTHFFTVARDLYNPFPLKAGDVMDVEYSLTMLPSEVTREEIEDLNEADLHLFGTAAEQSAPIVGWLGTKSAVGLLRQDGSMTLLGLGREPDRFPLPAATQGTAIAAYRLFGLVEPTYEYLDLSRGTVGVRPGGITVVDCGAALWEPVPEVSEGIYAEDGAAGPGQTPGDAGDAGYYGTLPGASGGGPIEGILRRK